MKYTFGEVRKTAVAVGGLLSTVLAYVLADENLRHLIPPQWVALATGILTVIGVFKVPNADGPTDAERVAAATKAAADAVAAARQSADAKDALNAESRQQVESAITDLATSIGGPVAGAIVRQGATAVETAINSIPKLP